MALILAYKPAQRVYSSGALFAPSWGFCLCFGQCDLIWKGRSLTEEGLIFLPSLFGWKVGNAARQKTLVSHDCAAAMPAVECLSPT